MVGPSPEAGPGRARHFMLMTATPHRGKEADFQLLMEMLADGRFEGRFREGVHGAEIADMMRRLTNEELKTFDGRQQFPEPRAHTVNYELSADEADLYEEVIDYVRDEMNRAERLVEGDQRRHDVGFALRILQRRLACRHLRRVDQRIRLRAPDRRSPRPPRPHPRDER
jgi:hypothetical protein